MLKFLLASVLIFCFSGVEAQLVEEYGPCGGESHIGPRICAPGLTCFRRNQFFSICLKCDWYLGAGDCSQNNIGTTKNILNQPAPASLTNIFNPPQIPLTVGFNPPQMTPTIASRPPQVLITNPFIPPSSPIMNVINQVPTRDLPIYYGCRNQRTVALTFDDGPNSQTLQLLNVLKAYGVKAAFFVLGNLVRDSYQKSIIKQIVADGHLIASHGYSHTSIYSLDNYRISQELENTANSIREAVGVLPIHFRPPYGDITDSTGAYIRSLGYKIVKWNVDPIDWGYSATPQSITDKVRYEVRANNGGIVLMHDIYSRTNQALPSIINFLRSEAFNIVRLDECL